MFACRKTACWLRKRGREGREQWVVPVVSWQIPQSLVLTKQEQNTLVIGDKWYYSILPDSMLFNSVVTLSVTLSVTLLVANWITK